MLSTLGPPKLAGALASVADIFILPTLDPMPLYINLSVNISPLIPVTSVLIVVFDARVLPSESLIVSTFVKFSASP